MGSEGLGTARPGAHQSPTREDLRQEARSGPFGAALVARSPTPRGSGAVGRPKLGDRARASQSPSLRALTSREATTEPCPGHRNLNGSRGRSRSGTTSLARPQAPHRAARAMRHEGCSRAPNTAAVTEPHEFTFGAASVYKIQKMIAKTSYGRDGGAAPLGQRGSGRSGPGGRSPAPHTSSRRIPPARPQSRGRAHRARSPEAPYARRLSSRGASGKSPAARIARHRGPGAAPLPTLGAGAAGAARRGSPPADPQGSAAAPAPRGGRRGPFRVHNGINGSRRQRAGMGSTERTRNGHVSAVQRPPRRRTGAGTMCGSTPGALGPVPSFPLARHRC